MSRHCRHVWINGVTLANGVNLAGKYGGGSLSSQGPQYKITGSGTTGLAPNPSTGQGGLITFGLRLQPVRRCGTLEPVADRRVRCS
ncbi:hypothetical protein QFZ97_008695 [Paraburkholderia youngii]